MQFELLEKLYKKSEITADELKSLFPEYIPYLAGAGRLDLIKRMVETIGEAKNLKSYIVTGKALVEASKAGHTEMVNYLLYEISTPANLLQKSFYDRPLSSDDKHQYQAMEEAARGGHFDVVKLLVAAYKSIHSRIDDRIDYLILLNVLSDSKSMDMAAENNHADILKFLIDEYKIAYGSFHHTSSRPPLPHQLIEAAVKRDSVDLVKALRPYLDSYKVHQLEGSSLKQNKQKVFMYLFGKKKMVRHLVYDAYFAAEYLEHASIVNRLLKILPDVDEELISGLDDKKGTYPAFHAACNRGYTKLLDKILEFVPIENRLEMFTSKKPHSISGLQTAANKEKVRFIPVLLERAADNAFELVKQDDYLSLRIAVKKGLIDSVKLMLDKVPEADKSAALSHIPEKWQKVLSDEPKRHLLWQEIGKGRARWQAVNRGKNPPERVRADITSPYFFSQKVYDDLLPLMREVAKVEGNAEAEYRTYKLAVLFPNTQEALRYLRDYTETNKEKKQPIHDACLFELPINGIWNVSRWKDLVLKYGYGFAEYLEHAAKVERVVTEDKIEFPDSPAKIRALASKFHYERAAERPDLARVAMEYKVSEERFNMALDFLKKNGKASDNLPPIFLDGNDLFKEDSAINPKISGFYMVKLDASDPRALFLGDITNCCQSIGKEGDPFAKHGASSADGGFYVWKKKTDGKITEDDPIIAQSWAWISQNNAVTFDSYERLSGDYNFLLKPFLDKFEEIATGAPPKYGFKRVTIGKGGETPKDLPYPDAEPPERPKDFKYRGTMEATYDSKTQYWVKRTDLTDDKTKEQPSKS